MGNAGSSGDVSCMPEGSSPPRTLFDHPQQKRHDLTTKRGHPLTIGIRTAKKGSLAHVVYRCGRPDEPQKHKGPWILAKGNRTQILAIAVGQTNA